MLDLLKPSKIPVGFILKGAPPTVFVLVSLISVFLWRENYRHHADQLRTEASVTAAQVARRLSLFVQDRMSVAAYFQDARGVIRQGIPVDFRHEAQRLVAVFPEIQAINWVDKSGIIRVTVPAEGNEAALGRNLHENPNPSVREAIVKSAETSSPTRTAATIELLQGGLGFASYSPLISEAGEVEGFVNVVFKVDSVVQHCLKEPELAGRFRLALMENDGSLVYTSDSSHSPESWAMGTKTTLRFVDRDLQLALAPLPTLLGVGGFSPNNLGLIFGLALATVLAWVTLSISRRGEALRRGRKQFEEIFDDAPVAYMHLNGNGTIIRANRRAYELTGCSREELVGSQAISIYSRSDNGARKVEALFSKLGTGEIPVIEEEELEIRRKDGGLRAVLLSSIPVHDAQGTITETHSTLTDITKTKEAEIAHRHSEERFKQLAENIEGIFWLTTTDIPPKVLYLSPGHESILGRLIEDPSEYLDIWHEMIHPEDRERMLRAYATHGSPKAQDEEYRIVRPDGDIRWIHARSFLILDDLGTPYRVAGISQDITTRKEAERALRFAQFAVENNADATYRMRFDGRILSVNEAACNTLGYTHEELLTMKVQNFDPDFPDDLWPQHWHDMKEAGAMTFEAHHQKKSGDIFPVEIQTSFIEYDGEEYVWAFVRDITRRRKYEDEKLQLSTAIDQADDAIVIIDPNGIIQYCNPSFELLTGYGKESITGRLLNSKNMPEEHVEEMTRAMQSGNSWNAHYEGVSKDGRRYTTNLTVSPVFDHAGVIRNFVVTQQDITEHIELEKQLRQSQKLEAVGTLAAGIAHDFNNILQSIIGYCQLAKERHSGEDEVLVQCLDEIDIGGTRAAELVDQIVTFSRATDVERKPLKLQPLIIEVVHLLRASLPVSIEIRTFVSPECGVVMADATQIHQVLMNLCTNAYHAMEAAGGTLEIHLEEKYIDVERAAFIGNLSIGNYVCVTVQDSGSGMTLETRDRIFEPYFTTKEIGRGTGLGLATVHGIVRQTGGAIDFTTAIGVGTSFKVYFPVITSDVIDGEDDSPRAQASNVTGRRVLYVDDEEAIAKLASLALKSRGFEVMAFTNPYDALEVFSLDPGAFDVVISDLTMPKMTGIEFASKIHSLRKNIPILVCSGAVDPMPAGESGDGEIREFLKKPLDLDLLAEAITRNINGNE